MAITTTVSGNADSVSNFQSGKLVIDSGGPSTGLLLSLGFVPRYLQLWNVTDASAYEWFDGMPAASAKKTVTAGTLTYITANGITVGAAGASGDGATVPGEGQVFIDPALIPASKTVYFMAEG